MVNVQFISFTNLLQRADRIKDVAGSGNSLYLRNNLQGVESDISITFQSAKCTTVSNRTNNQLKEQYVDNLGVIEAVKEFPSILSCLQTVSNALYPESKRCLHIYTLFLKACV